MKKNLLTLMLASSTLLSFAQKPAIDLYRAGTSKLNHVWSSTPDAGAGTQTTLTVTEVSTGSPYEGTQHLQMDYDIKLNTDPTKGGWFAGGAWNINNWSGNKADYSGYTHLVIAYKSTGANPDNSLNLYFTDSTKYMDGPDEKFVTGPVVKVGSHSATYKVVSIPLSSFIGPAASHQNIDFSNVHTLNYSVTTTVPETNGQFFIDNIQIVDNSVTSIANKFETLNVSIGPNPSSGIYTINSQENIDAVIVTDQLGNVLSNNSDLEIDLTNQADGLYFVTIVSGEKRAVKKLVKK